MLSREEVRAIRHAAGYSQAELAAVLGVTVSAVQKWENMQSHPNANAERALRVLNTPRSIQRRQIANDMEAQVIALQEAGENRTATTVSTIIQYLRRPVE